MGQSIKLDTSPSTDSIRKENKKVNNKLQKRVLFMQVNEQAYAQKIHSYSKPTLQKIMTLMTSEEAFIRIRKIVIESKTEQEVMEKLNKL